MNVPPVVAPVMSIVAPPRSNESVKVVPLSARSSRNTSCRPRAARESAVADPRSAYGQPMRGIAVSVSVPAFTAVMLRNAFLRDPPESRTS
jgi:hypothetical protein